MQLLFSEVSVLHMGFLGMTKSKRDSGGDLLKRELKPCAPGSPPTPS